MAVLKGPFEPAYPIDFRSDGDTTKEFAGKHIQEIERIYGIINALNAASMSTNEFSDRMKAHIESTDPHPNWKLTFDDILGDLDGSRIINELTRATIDKSRVIGLEAFVQKKIDAIPQPENKGDGITEYSSGTNGYVKFKNGLIVQWGISSGKGMSNQRFPISFPNVCFTVLVSLYLNDGKLNGCRYGDDGDSEVLVNAWDKTSFGFSSFNEDLGEAAVSFIAIGR